VNWPARSLIRNLTRVMRAPRSIRVTRRLGRPRAVRVRSDAGQVHPAGAMFYEDQGIEAPQQHGVHVRKSTARIPAASAARNCFRCDTRSHVVRSPNSYFRAGQGGRGACHTTQRRPHIWLNDHEPYRQPASWMWRRKTGEASGGFTMCRNSRATLPSPAADAVAARAGEAALLLYGVNSIDAAGGCAVRAVRRSR
jgi:hypothetical protein